MYCPLTQSSFPLVLTPGVLGNPWSHSSDSCLPVRHWLPGILAFVSVLWVLWLLKLGLPYLCNLLDTEKYQRGFLFCFLILLGNLAGEMESFGMITYFAILKENEIANYKTWEMHVAEYQRSYRQHVCADTTPESSTLNHSSISGTQWEFYMFGLNKKQHYAYAPKIFFSIHLEGWAIEEMEYQ